MTATTSAITIKRQDSDKTGVPVAASSSVLEGTIVCVGNSAGGLMSFATTVTSPTFMGVAAESKDNSSGALGALDCAVWHSGVFEFKFSGTFATTSVGEKAYAADNQTLRMSGTNALTGCIYVGEVTDYISATRGKVRIDRAVGV